MGGRSPNLRKDIEGFGGFQILKPNNYALSEEEWQEQLVTNLTNTEIDIVLESPNHLFIGEAKHEMSFGAGGDLVLVHQLVRQYVMATILIEISQNLPKKRIIPFVVGDRVAKLKKATQVKFMISQGWLSEKNILEWDDINDFTL